MVSTAGSNRVVPDSTLGPEIDYLDGDFSWFFLQSLLEKLNNILEIDHDHFYIIHSRSTFDSV
jgi:hypothetical protein